MQDSVLLCCYHPTADGENTAPRQCGHQVDYNTLIDKGIKVCKRLLCYLHNKFPVNVNYEDEKTDKKGDADLSVILLKIQCIRTRD